MSQGNGVKVDERKSLAERITSSPQINRSARLRDMLLYLVDRVLNEEASEIHEQEVGHKVFGRPTNYDTATDNIVRVHASMLRKRLERYFHSEGAEETLILEIPKGNYAPVFRERSEVEPKPAEHLPVKRRKDWRIRVLAALTTLLACAAVFLLVRPVGLNFTASSAGRSPTVRLFWSQVFQPDRPTDIVLDDAAVGLFQELTGRSLTLSDYFDRDYLRSLPERAAAAKLDQPMAASIVLRRHSSFADTSFLWKLFQMPGADQRHPLLRFARDYSFRDLKANNAVLLGNSRFNLWEEPFLPKLGIRWLYDSAGGVYYPVDTWDAGKSYQGADPGETHEGYCSISLLPNLGGSGNVLIISGTGGSAMNAGADFLADEQALSELRRRVPRKEGNGFPHFEALIRVKGRSSAPRDATIVVCRAPRA